MRGLRIALVVAMLAIFGAPFAVGQEPLPPRLDPNSDEYNPLAPADLEAPDTPIVGDVIFDGPYARLEITAELRSTVDVRRGIDLLWSGPGTGRPLMADLGALPQGRTEVSVTATDREGNTSESAHKLIVVEEAGQLDLSLTSAPGESPLELTIVGPPGTVGEIRVVGADDVVVRGYVLDESGTAEVTIVAPAGALMIEATGTDEFGRDLPIATLDEAFVDSEPPSLSIAVDDPAGANGRVAFSVTAEAGAAITMRIAALDFEESFTTDGSPVERSFEADNGDYRIEVTATDDIGNTITKTVIVTVNAPAVPRWVAKTFIGAVLVAGVVAAALWLLRRRHSRYYADGYDTDGYDTDGYDDAELDITDDTTGYDAVEWVDDDDTANDFATDEMEAFVDDPPDQHRV